MLLGGPPFGEQIVMWWNFVGRTHEEVVAFRQEWQDQLVRDGALVRDSQEVADGRFGIVVGDHLPPIPAPEMPQGVRLRSARAGPRPAGTHRRRRALPGSRHGRSGGRRRRRGALPVGRGEGMQAYHDTEWGLRVHGESAYLERLTLEAFQSGLSWSTILNKREAFREVFAGFDADVVAAYDEPDVLRLMEDARIVRNRRKIDATVANARATVALREDGGLSPSSSATRPRSNRRPATPARCPPSRPSRWPCPRR